MHGNRLLTASNLGILADEGFWCLAVQSCSFTTAPFYFVLYQGTRRQFFVPSARPAWGGNFRRCREIKSLFQMSTLTKSSVKKQLLLLSRLLLGVCYLAYLTPAADTPPKDALYRRLEAVTMRSSWTDPNGFFTGLKAGRNAAGHGHLDNGMFILDALGERWAVDMGLDRYSLPGYFSTGNQSSQRWVYYRCRTEGQNTLTISANTQQPLSFSSQHHQGRGTITSLETTPAKTFAVADLTDAYRPIAGDARQVSKVNRGVMLLGNEQTLIQDEVVAGSPVEVIWNFHTRAAISIQGTVATLTQNGKSMKVEILSPAGASFQVVTADPGVTSNPDLQQNRNAGVRNLTVRLAEKTTGATIAVRILPANSAAPRPTIEALANWSNVAAIPATPGNLTAKTVSSTQIDLSWTDNAINETSYLVERSDSANGSFRQIITVPASSTNYADVGLTANKTYQYRIRASSFGLRSEYSNVAGAITSPEGGTTTTTYLSDLNWTSASNGWGPVRKDRSNGESQVTADGPLIILNGTTYPKGLGTHANSIVTYQLAGRYARFLSQVGVDDEAGSNGLVNFQVYLDNVLAYESGLMNGSSATKGIDLNVGGKNELKLVVTDGGNGIYYDHSDWAAARVVSVSNPVSDPAVYLSDLSWTSATSSWGPVEKDRSNGENGAGDGRTLTLNGTTYAKGLGAHAYSNIIYNLGGRYSSFISDVGLDDEVAGSGKGSVGFEVYLDGVLAYTSGPMFESTVTKNINLNVSGKNELRLVVTNAGDNYDYDHADWAGARLIPGSSAREAVAERSMAEIRVYPVPAREEIHVGFVAERGGEATVELTSALAGRVARVTQRVAAGENTVTVPVRQLGKGFYVLTLTQGNQRVTRKVLITK